MPARMAIPPPKAHQKTFISRPRAQNSHARLALVAAQAVAQPTATADLCDGQNQETSSAPAPAMTAPSTAARRAVLRTAEAPDESEETV